MIADNGIGLVLSAVVWVPLAATAFVRVGGRPAVEWAGTAVSSAPAKAAGQTSTGPASPSTPPGGHPGPARRRRRPPAAPRRACRGRP